MKYWGSYPWGVCQGPRPLKSESGRMEWPPAQTVRGAGGAWSSTPSNPLGPGWPRGEVQSFGWWGPTLPSHRVAPQCARDAQFLVCGRGYVRAPQARDHIVGVWVPRAGWGVKSKVEGFFAGAKSLGAASQPDPLCATQTVTCLEWPHISPTLLQKQVRDRPSIQGVERGFVQGGLCPLSVIARYPAGKYCQILGGSPWPDQWWDLNVLFGDFCPTLFLSGPGNAESVAPSVVQTQGPKEGAHQRGENRHFSPCISGRGCEVGMPLLVRWEPVCPHAIQEGWLPATQAKWSPRGRSLTLTHFQESYG